MQTSLFEPSLYEQNKTCLPRGLKFRVSRENCDSFWVSIEATYKLNWMPRLEIKETDKIHKKMKIKFREVF